MLSIGVMQSGQADYYQKLAREDYYLEGGEPPGTWLGRGAKALGFSGEVKADVLAALFEGFDATGKPLVQNAGKETRRPGWDLTLSAPKSVSVLWSQAETSSDRREIEAAQEAAVAATINFIEDHFAFSRIGKRGTEQIDVQLVVAAFEHSTSRAFDPQLHTHCLVMNLGVDEAGTVRSILSKPFYQQKMLAGAFYRCELSRQLQERLGVTIERPRDSRGNPAAWFEVKGVSKSILSHFSKRRAAIEAELGSLGMESASAAAFAALSTRESKTVVPPRRELQSRWKEEGTALGFSPQDLLSLASRSEKEIAAANLHSMYREALASAVADLTFAENSFTKSKLIQSTLIAAQEKQLPAALVAGAVEHDLATEPFFVSLGVRNGEGHYSTKEVISGEQEFLLATETLRGRRFEPVAEKHVVAAADAWRGKGGSKFQLDAEQQQAVRYITQGTESIKVVSGFAGTGKTDMLAAAKEALEKGGYQVIGTALAGVAARNLEEKTGIQSETVRKREYQLSEHTFGDKFKHHVRQLGRAAIGKKTWSLPQLEIDSRTVLVIDEAGMLGTRDFSLLARAVVDRGGSIVAVGDEKQLASIERGGGFQHLVDTLRGVRLNEIRRQTDLADRQAVKDVVASSPEVALQHYAKKGQFFVGSDRADVEAELISDWQKNGGAERPELHRIFAGTRDEVSRLNALCQQERLAAGLLDASEQVEHEGTTFMVGDKVRFNIAAKTRGIQKGESGTVLACKEGFTGKYVTVALGNETPTWSERARTLLKHHATQLLAAALGKQTTPPPPRHDVVLVPLESPNPLKRTYQGLSLDYCSTVHLGQGQTVPNAYFVLGGSMTDRELSYVAMSRHQEKLWLYAAEPAAGRTLTDIARKHRQHERERALLSEELPDYSMLTAQMRQSRAKELATSFNEPLLPPHTESLHATENEQHQRR